MNKITRASGAPEQINELLTRGVDTVYPTAAGLEKLLKSGKKLTLYNGVDPSGEDLHIGHAVVLQKLRQFQRLGHKVILLIGSFTAQTGDPTDKQAVRQPKTKQQVLANAKHYQRQAASILEFGGNNPVEVRYNGDWLEKLDFAEVAELAGHFTVQQMLERDMFQERLKVGKPISLREFLYPLMQGYDSVAMKVDLEVGGTDQTFNMLAGRKLAKEYLGKEKLVLTTPLLTDTKGVKIGKSEGNEIALSGKPEDLYGQIMALPDEVIVDAVAWCTSVSLTEVQAVAKLRGQAPRDAKMKLAYAMVREFQGEPAAKKGEAYFVEVFQQHAAPTTVAEWRAPKAKMMLWQVLKESGLAASSSEARRLIDQGAVKINDKVSKDPESAVPAGESPLVQVGKKRFLRIVR